jgi:hypothetical protein
MDANIRGTVPSSVLSVFNLIGIRASKTERIFSTCPRELLSRFPGFLLKPEIPAALLTNSANLSRFDAVTPRKVDYLSSVIPSETRNLRSGEILRFRF